MTPRLEENEEAVMVQKILVPIDGSDRSVSVLPMICGLAGSSGAEIVLLQVVEYPCSAYPEVYDYPTSDQEVMEVVQKTKNVICQQVKDKLDQIAASVVTRDVSVRAEFREGPVVESILDAAERLGADLIAMAAYGENGTIPWMIGSVADRVLREAAVPVLLFRPVGNPEPIRLARDPVLAV